MHRFTVAEYARLMNISEATVRRRIKAGELNTELIDGITHISLERLPVSSERLSTTVTDDSQLQLMAQFQERIIEQQSEIKYLRNELSEARQRTDEIIRQMQEDSSEAQQRSDTIILQLTQKFDEQTKLLEDMRHRSLWSRVKMAFGVAAS